MDGPHTPISVYLRVIFFGTPYTCMGSGSSVSTSPEIQKFSGFFGIFKDRKSTFREYKRNQELAASYTIDIEDWNIL